VKDRNRLIYWTAGLSVFSLIAHAIDAPDHLQEWWVYGAVFVIIASFQFFLGVSLFLRPWRYDDEGNVRGGANDRFGRPYYILGAAFSAVIVVLYLITRTSGMPFLGPDAAREPVTILSLIPPVVNLPLLYCFVILARRAASSPQERSAGTS
jgi:hypothetical protein